MDINCGMELHFAETSNLEEPDFVSQDTSIPDKLDLGSNTDDVQHLLVLDQVSSPSQSCHHDNSGKHLTAADFKLDLGPANDLVSATDFPMENSVAEMSSENCTEENSEGYSIVNAALEGTTDPKQVALSQANMSTIPSLPLTSLLPSLQPIQVIPIANLQNIQLVNSSRGNVVNVGAQGTSDLSVGSPKLVNFLPGSSGAVQPKEANSVFSPITDSQKFASLNSQAIKSSNIASFPNLDSTQKTSSNGQLNNTQSLSSAVVLGNVLLLQPISGQLQSTLPANKISLSAIASQVPFVGSLNMAVNSQNLSVPNSTVLDSNSVSRSRDCRTKMDNSNPVLTSAVSACSTSIFQSTQKVGSSVATPGTNVFSPGLLENPAIAKTVAETLPTVNVENKELNNTAEISRKGTKILIHGKTISMTFDCRHPNVLSGTSSSVGSCPVSITPSKLAPNSVLMGGRSGLTGNVIPSALSSVVQSTDTGTSSSVMSYVNAGTISSTTESGTLDTNSLVSGSGAILSLIGSGTSGTTSSVIGSGTSGTTSSVIECATSGTTSSVIGSGTSGTTSSVVGCGTSGTTSSVIGSGTSGTTSVVGSGTSGTTSLVIGCRSSGTTSSIVGSGTSGTTSSVVVSLTSGTTSSAIGSGTSGTTSSVIGSGMLGTTSFVVGSGTSGTTSSLVGSGTSRTIFSVMGPGTSGNSFSISPSTGQNELNAAKNQSLLGNDTKYPTQQFLGTKPTQIVTSTGNGCIVMNAEHQNYSQVKYVSLLGTKPNQRTQPNTSISLEGSECKVQKVMKVDILKQQISNGLNAKGRSSEMDTKGDNSSELVIQPLIISNSKMEYKCDLCSASFNRYGNYTRHRMIHTVNTKDDYRYKCQECGRLFLQRCDMKRHMLIHSNEQPFRCEICGKGYIRRSDLVVHVRFHKKEKKFTCVCCNKQFYQSGDLNRHVRNIHLQSTLLTCGHCSRQFAKEATLIRHMQTRHKDIIIKTLKDKDQEQERVEEAIEDGENNTSDDIACDSVKQETDGLENITDHDGLVKFQASITKTNLEALPTDFDGDICSQESAGLIQMKPPTNILETVGIVDKNTKSLSEKVILVECDEIDIDNNIMEADDMET